MEDRDMTTTEIWISMVVLLIIGMLIVGVRVESEGRAKYHKKLCNERIAHAETAADTLTVYLNDSVCFPAD